MENPKYLVTVFISGFCAMIVEIAGGRIIAPYLGTTIFTWSAVIGLVLGALSIGYYIGGRLGDKYNNVKQLSLILIVAGFLTLTVPFFARLLLPATMFIDLKIASIIAAFILVPSSLFYGMVSPYIIKLAIKKDSEGSVAGDIFSTSTVGSILGVLVTGFILIPNIPISVIFILGAFLMLLSSVILSRRIPFIELGVFLVVSFFMSGISYSHFVEGNVLYEGESPYYYITVTDTVFDNKSGILLGLDSAYYSSGQTNDGDFLFDYAKKVRLTYPLLRDPKSFLILGNAAGTQAMDLRKNFPDSDIDTLEIDDRLIDIGKKYFNFKPDERLRVINDDARRYVKATNLTYDMIIVDTYRGKSLPYHLTTVEFVSELKHVLKDDGLVVANTISPLGGESSETIKLIYLAYRSMFNDVFLIPMNHSDLGSQNILLIASDRDLGDFRIKYSDLIYNINTGSLSVPTDELNPIELFGH
ncbi:MAG: fused MFS/spermidine synthase [Candidatus Micrarchaeota archaeon]